MKMTFVNLLFYMLIGAIVIYTSYQYGLYNHKSDYIPKPRKDKTGFKKEYKRRQYRQEIVDMYNNGYNVKTISKEMNVPYYTVYNYCIGRGAEKN